MELNALSASLARLIALAALGLCASLGRRTIMRLLVGLMTLGTVLELIERLAGLLAEAI